MSPVCLLFVAALLGCARAYGVNTKVTAMTTTPGIGSTLYLNCEVKSFPRAEHYWTKDGARLQPYDRTSMSGSKFHPRLTVSRLTASDSGLYGCNANNSYGSHSDTVQINVEKKRVPAGCTDNVYVNCERFVRYAHYGFCKITHYGKDCCKSCVEAGVLDPQEAELLTNQPLRSVQSSASPSSHSRQ